MYIRPLKLSRNTKNELCKNQPRTDRTKKLNHPKIDETESTE